MQFGLTESVRAQRMPRGEIKNMVKGRWYKTNISNYKGLACAVSHYCDGHPLEGKVIGAETGLLRSISAVDEVLS